MKRVMMILILVGSVATIISALPTPDAQLRPKILLPEAYPLAVRALGADTNRFACLQALWSSTKDVPEGKWLFVFVSTNGASKGVTVFSDKKTQLAPIFTPPGRP